MQLIFLIFYWIKFSYINVYFVLNNWIFVFFNKLFFLYFFLCILVMLLIFILSTAFMTLFERKQISSLQHRRGPNNVGLMGILQPFADALKLLLKEIVIPRNSIFFIFIGSPVLAAFFGFLNWALFPFSTVFSTIADLHLGIFFFLLFLVYTYTPLF